MTNEWRDNWTLVLASMAGLSFVAVASATIGLFMEPLETEFGWSRAEVTAGLTIYALVAVPLSPFVGALIDRWGSRRLAIPGIILTSAAVAGFGLASGSMVQWLVLWSIFAFFALSIKNTVWTTAVSSVFDKARGLALAFTLSGSAVAQTFGPVIAQRLVDGFGWREAYLWLGFGWGGIVLALLIPFFFDARDLLRTRKHQSTGAEPARMVLPGLSPAEALRSMALIRLALATLVITLVLSSISIHLVPMLNGRGISRETAALLAALAGGCAIPGKLVTGWLYDRGFGAWLSAVSLGMPAGAAILLLTSEKTILMIGVAVMIIGFANGAFIQVCAYLTGRYGGIRHYGTIFGVMASLIALGVGIGPVVAGLIFDVTGDYKALLGAAIPAAVVAGVLVSALGAYPDWAKSQGQAAGTGSAGRQP